MAINQYSLKTLLGNWSEEQACVPLDKDEDMLKVQRTGHKGIMGADDSPSYETTNINNFTSPSKSVDTVGTRTKLMEQRMYEHAAKLVEETSKPPKVEIDYTSTTKKAFTREFDSSRPPPVLEHNVNTDNAITYWSSSAHSGIHGVTNITTNDTPFRKNTAFSTPIEESQDRELPHGDQHR
ncbi:hypothetical protein LOD99_1204 [Oopsacas minuta]|uniref:Uncharacterized protein n=1 Tax=Oopsacas minuta TaxID=111878 RepID=A0AAV7K551_9METZ|nr:hypothetical protein LOD99_1204 [Oopsacas minuta]